MQKWLIIFQDIIKENDRKDGYVLKNNPTNFFVQNTLKPIFSENKINIYFKSAKTRSNFYEYSNKQLLTLMKFIERIVK